MASKFQFQIDETVRKNRLDLFLFDKITAVSKIFLSKAIKRGDCKINGTAETRGGYHLQKGDSIEIEVDLQAETAMKPENISLEIIFEDEEIIVVNKPAGMLVHPTFAQKTGTLLNALAFYLNNNQRQITNSASQEKANSHSAIIRPGLIHRLDRETSGLLIVGKTKRACRILSKHLMRGLFEKKYLALVEGIVEKDNGKITAPIGRFEEEKRWGVKTGGKYSETLYCVEKRFSDKSLLSLVPVTGRTNQLRIHCAHLGHPIIGDKMYNGREHERLCLHASNLSFYHPNGKNRLSFENLISF